MIDRNSPVTEDELHAYVDGELPADRQDAVTAWLSAYPEQAALVAAWRAQADAIRARYGAVANEPVPDRLKLDRRDAAGPRERQRFMESAGCRGGRGRIPCRRRRRLGGARRDDRRAEQL